MVAGGTVTTVSRPMSASTYIVILVGPVFGAGGSPEQALRRRSGCRKKLPTRRRDSSRVAQRALLGLALWLLTENVKVRLDRSATISITSFRQAQLPEGLL
jgi:hypothetical protein